MFRLGRKRSGTVRGFAGLSVALMLSGLYRPSFAMVSGGTPPRSGAGEQGQAAVTPAALPVKAAAPVERVRSSIAPAALRSEAQGDDPWRLFDGDGATTYTFVGTVRVRAKLPAETALETIGVYGSANASLAVYTTSSAGPKPVAGLEKIDLRGQPMRWNRIDAAGAPTASELILELSAPLGESAEVRELELWGGAPLTAPRDLTSSTAAVEALLTGLPPGATKVTATPSEAAVSPTVLGQAGAVKFRLDLDRPVHTLERAFLIYELEGLPHWSAVPRQINGQAVQGGFAAGHAAHGGRQVEEISPDWLRAGQNEIAFLVANHDDPRGYKVKNVRIVGIPAAGNPAAFVPTFASGAATPAALLDGNRETAALAKDVRKRGSVFDLAFDGPTQPDSLLLAVEKGAKGAVSARAIVRGKLSGRETVANLEELPEGWNRLRLDDRPTQADGVRITLNAGYESTAPLVSELRVTGSRVPNRPAAGLVVTYPLHGECVDGRAYVRGFLRTAGVDAAKGAVLRVDGIARPGALAADGAFSAVLEPPSAAARKGGKWHTDLEANLANGEATGGRVEIDGCREPEPVSQGGPREDEGAPYGQMVRAGQAATLSFAGATLEIPAGAVDKDTRITVRPIEGIEVPATDETLTNVTPSGRAYRLGPHGLKFSKPVALTVPYDRSRFVGGQEEDDMGVFFFDEEAKHWSQVQTVRGNAGARTLVAATGHFTDFITATISSPDHPAADSFNPNSIKDMKVGDPASGIDLIAPPQPGPDGAAHLSFPLWVPPGRQGMQPSLTATYSSDAANGILGVGWDLSISSIMVDTRFGVPKYDSASETETYLLDGEILVPDSANQQRGQKATFHRRSEGKFDTIIRNGPGPVEPASGGNATYTWEVIDKHGVHYFYGENFDARGSVAGRGVFQWHLSRAVDAFGNQILYQYDKRVAGFHGNSNVLAVEVYPKKIDYTADSAGLNPFYRILFQMDDGKITPNVANDHAPRLDPFSSARGGTIALTAHRLIDVFVFRAGQESNASHAIRRYNLLYTTGDFQKSLVSDIRVLVPTPNDEFGNFSEFYRHSFAYSSMKKATSGRPSFEAPSTSGQVNDSQGMGSTSSESLSGTAQIGAGPGGCALFHVAAGGSTTIDLPIPVPDQFPHDNQDRGLGDFVDINGDGLAGLHRERRQFPERGDSRGRCEGLPERGERGHQRLGPAGIRRPNK